MIRTPFYSSVPLYQRLRRGTAGHAESLICVHIADDAGYMTASHAPVGRKRLPCGAERQATLTRFA